MLDLLLKGGDLVDGTGKPRTRADVGVRDGRVVSIGPTQEEAAEVVDVSGFVVCPGFIDVHTHFDAQVFWDPFLTPSSLYGVTTVMGGNCGFSIAPLSEQTADYIMRMLARVEGMPLDALAAGVPWDWRTTAEYLDCLEGRVGINCGFMVGHSPIRRMVMGPESTTRHATVEEIEQMAALVRDGLDAGGMGFSTSYNAAHQDGDGVPVPSRHATEDELVTLAAVCRDFPGTSLVFNPLYTPRGDSERVMIAMSQAAQRPVNWNVMRILASTVEDVQLDLEPGTHARERGARIVALTMPMKSRVRFSFYTAFALDGLPGWGPTMALPVEERLKALLNPGVRRELETGAKRAKGASLKMTDWGTKIIAECLNPELKHYEGRDVAEIAETEGKTTFDALLDIVCADDLRATFFINSQADMTHDDWKAAAALWRDDRAMIGASDAGAHLDLTGNFDYATYVLEHAVREHQVIGLEEAIHLMTEVPARFYGVKDRGRLVPGSHADIVVFDEKKIASNPLETRFDLPAGAGRLTSEPLGIERVYVNGTPAVIRGELTGNLAGKVIRSGRDTETPSLVA